MKLKFQDGLVPAVIQDEKTDKVLMLGYMNSAALEATLSSGFVTFFSRSRKKLWVKGETSGHKLRVRAVRTDCDRDALVIRAELAGPGCCHLGYESCFFRALAPEEAGAIVEPQRFDPDEVYKEKRP